MVDDYAAAGMKRLLESSQKVQGAMKRMLNELAGRCKPFAAMCRVLSNGGSASDSILSSFLDDTATDCSSFTVSAGDFASLTLGVDMGDS